MWCPSLLSRLQQQNFGIHPWWMWLCGNRGIQHHPPRDARGVFPPCALGDQQTDLSPGCGPCGGPLADYSPGVSGEHWLQQSPPVEIAFVKVQVSRREMKFQHSIGMKSTSLDMLEFQQGEQFVFTHITPPPRWHSLPRRTLLGLWFLLQGKGE